MGFYKNIGHIRVQLFDDGWPPQTAIEYKEYKFNLFGEEEVRDLYYLLGRVIDHMERKEKGT